MVVCSTSYYLKYLVFNLLHIPKDSGSPLVQIDNDGNVEQVGITSWIAADPCGQVNAPSVYVQVSAYIDWIEFIMENN